MGCNYTACEGKTFISQPEQKVCQTLVRGILSPFSLRAKINPGPKLHGHSVFTSKLETKSISGKGVKKGSIIQGGMMQNLSGEPKCLNQIHIELYFTLQHLFLPDLAFSDLVIVKKKSGIWETLNLPMCADCSTDTKKFHFILVKRKRKHKTS